MFIIKSMFRNFMCNMSSWIQVHPINLPFTYVWTQLTACYLLPTFLHLERITIQLSVSCKHKPVSLSTIFLSQKEKFKSNLNMSVPTTGEYPHNVIKKEKSGIRKKSSCWQRAKLFAPTTEFILRMKSKCTLQLTLM